MKNAIFAIIVLIISTPAFAQLSPQAKAQKAFSCSLIDRKNSEFPRAVLEERYLGTRSQAMPTTDGTYILNGTSDIFFIAENGTEVIKGEAATEKLATLYSQNLQQFLADAKLEITQESINQVVNECEGISVNLDQTLAQLKKRIPTK